ncbi:MAG: hypothetical protein NTV55_13565 [Planctomycetota bacterium]|nr:hypothetical protein [Planctomycetota bacterium]
MRPQKGSPAEATPVAQWVYWLCHAQEYEAVKPQTLLPHQGFQ